MSKPNTKSVMWMVIINDKKEATEQQSIATFQSYQNLLINYNIFSYAATIIHDKDTYTKEDQEKDPSHKEGTHKRVHLHAFIDTDKITLKEMLSHITGLLKIDNEQVSIEPTSNEFLGVQYLTHKNNQNKHQYEPNTIITSNAKETERRYGLKYETEEEKIQRVLETSSTLSKVIHEIGVEKANKYRGLFNDLSKEKRDYRIATYDKTLDCFVDLMNSLIDIRPQLDMMDGTPRVLEFRTTFNNALEILDSIIETKYKIEDYNKNLKK